MQMKSEYTYSGILQRQSKKFATGNFRASLISKITENEEHEKNDAQTTFRETHIRKITENDEENAPQSLNGQGLEIQNDEIGPLSID